MNAVKSFALCLALSLPGLCAGQDFVAFQVSAMTPDGGSSYLGVSVTGSEGNKGVEVIGVNDNGPAAKAGLKQGDILLSYNGEPIMGPRQLGRLVWETPAGRQVRIEYSRAGKTCAVVITTAAARLMTHPTDSDPAGWGGDMNPAFTDIPIPCIAWRNMLLGVEFEALSAQLAPSFGVHDGLLIRLVAPDSAADKAGIRAGDVIVEMNGHPIGNRQDLENALHIQGMPGKPMQIAVIRNRKRVAVTAQLGQ